MYNQKTLATEIIAAEKKRTTLWFAAFILTLTLAAFNRIKRGRQHEN